ncbi:S8 family serine peptidase [Clostridium sp. NSJ-145]|uniref:S8 family serine peptidase n=1 Tax=Clostridium sp. NSJ-145 TaxID=2897777 RepID=UPI001E5DE35A|nr:S8 family serine peptidase [Clostridium sp. NSJ-145]MCD2502742.1 S8 family serine peptidase [Clostridium sp. NSJ-145]
MFSLNKKLDSNLKNYMEFNTSRSYRVLIKCRNFQDSIEKRILSYKGTILRNINIDNIICAILNSQSINRLLEYPEVEYICLDQFFNLCGISVQTANRVRLSNSINASGRGVGIGVIDSGVYPHRDLTTPFNRIATFTDLINGLSFPYDDNGHGTCTCGVIAGNGESSNGIYKGIAPNSELHVIKAFNRLGKGYVSDVLYAINELISISPKYNIKILCLPFESLNHDKFIFSLFDKILKKAVDLGITPILPSGSNSIEGSIMGIALSKNAITVSGLDTTSKTTPYEYSSTGAPKKDFKPNFCAACVDIVSLNCNTSYISEKNNTKIYAPKLSSSYKSFSGTSISAAYISGICALLYELTPTLSFDDIVSMLTASSTNLDLPLNTQGEGCINLNKLFKK